MPKLQIDLVQWIGPILTVLAIAGSGYASYAVSEEQRRQMQTTINSHVETIDTLETDLHTLRRNILSQAGDQKVEIAELRGDVKLILRAIERLERP